MRDEARCVWRDSLSLGVGVGDCRLNARFVASLEGVAPSDSARVAAHIATRALDCSTHATETDCTAAAEYGSCAWDTASRSCGLSAAAAAEPQILRGRLYCDGSRLQAAAACASLSYNASACGAATGCRALPPAARAGLQPEARAAQALAEAAAFSERDAGEPSCGAAWLWDSGAVAELRAASSPLPEALVGSCESVRRVVTALTGTAAACAAAGGGGAGGAEACLGATGADGSSAGCSWDEGRCGLGSEALANALVDPNDPWVSALATAEAGCQALSSRAQCEAAGSFRFDPGRLDALRRVLQDGGAGAGGAARPGLTLVAAAALAAVAGAVVDPAEVPVMEDGRWLQRWPRCTKLILSFMGEGIEEDLPWLFERAPAEAAQRIKELTMTFLQQREATLTGEHLAGLLRHVPNLRTLALHFPLPDPVDNVAVSAALVSLSQLRDLTLGSSSWLRCVDNTLAGQLTRLTVEEPFDHRQHGQAPEDSIERFSQMTSLRTLSISTSGGECYYLPREFRALLDAVPPCLESLSSKALGPRLGRLVVTGPIRTGTAPPEPNPAAVELFSRCDVLHFTEIAVDEDAAGDAVMSLLRLIGVPEQLSWKRPGFDILLLKLRLPLPDDAAAQDAGAAPPAPAAKPTPRPPVLKSLLYVGRCHIGPATSKGKVFYTSTSTAFMQLNKQFQKKGTVEPTFEKLAGPGRVSAGWTISPPIAACLPPACKPL
ncbi:hypothetical protein HYH03_007242 [Edaphochlamys debaryana]|uniref:Uncharacterized protein n=1 Tax=Edaphochlamys debaryana TaxID=47281 RepID=A0A836C0P7_9CHLO|nr:hypothetical protein HYH03_007242 [Edaphochlamys debaryana]|eukprot:KAG2494728.1 hypothetical protein HYH03_007242 [Edaphochlamys debaryana]